MVDQLGVTQFQIAADPCKIGQLGIYSVSFCWQEASAHQSEKGYGTQNSKLFGIQISSENSFSQDFPPPSYCILCWAKTYWIKEHTFPIFFPLFLFCKINNSALRRVCQVGIYIILYFLVCFARFCVVHPSSINGLAKDDLEQIMCRIRPKWKDQSIIIPKRVQLLFCCSLVGDICLCPLW